MWSRHNCLVIITLSTFDCDVISRTQTERLRHWDDVWRSSLLSSSMNSLCRVRNEIMYALSWRTIYALIRVSFWCLFKHKKLSWAQKQFAIRVHTLFYIYPWASGLLHWSWSNETYGDSKFITCIHKKAHNKTALKHAAANRGHIWSGISCNGYGALWPKGLRQICSCEVCLALYVNNFMLLFVAKSVFCVFKAE